MQCTSNREERGSADALESSLTPIWWQLTQVTIYLVFRHDRYPSSNSLDSIVFPSAFFLSLITRWIQSSYWILHVKWMRRQSRYGGVLVEKNMSSTSELRKQQSLYLHIFLFQVSSRYMFFCTPALFYCNLISNDRMLASIGACFILYQMPRYNLLARSLKILWLLRQNNAPYQQDGPIQSSIWQKTTTFGVRVP